MGRILINTPDNWVVIKIVDFEDKPLYKVLAGWSGGYLYGDSWQMNSGIKSVVDHKDEVDFYGFSGSLYKCHKDLYRLRMNNAGIWDKIKDHYGDRVELMDEDTDWSKLVNANI